MWLKEQNNQLIPPPVNFVTPQGTIMNFNKNPDALVRYGWRDWQAEEVAQWDLQHHPQQQEQSQSHSQSQQPVEQISTKDFQIACAQFRQICRQIGAAIDRPNFKGGFEEMILFAQSPVYDTIGGLKLGLAWSAANENCKYEGSKMGLGQPQWWYKCWELEEPDSQE